MCHQIGRESDQQRFSHISHNMQLHCVQFVSLVQKIPYNNFLIDGTKPGEWPSKTFVSSTFNFHCSTPALLLCFLTFTSLLLPTKTFILWLSTLSVELSLLSFCRGPNCFLTFAPLSLAMAPNCILISHTLFFLQTRAAANSCLVNI